MIEKDQEIGRAEAEMWSCAQKLEAEIRDTQTRIETVEFRTAIQADLAFKAVNKVLNVIREQL